MNSGFRYLARKWHQGAGTYGREWKIGDIVGAFLDLSDRTISFSLNGELLLVQCKTTSEIFI